MIGAEAYCWCVEAEIGSAAGVDAADKVGWYC